MPPVQNESMKVEKIRFYGLAGSWEAGILPL